MCVCVCVCVCVYVRAWFVSTKKWKSRPRSCSIELGGRENYSHEPGAFDSGDAVVTHPVDHARGIIKNLHTRPQYFLMEPKN